MFVGEAPGAEEDRTGRPFVGEAGKLLDRMMASVGLERPDVYIGNIVKVRPAENRTPRPDECEACGPWLLARLAAIRPRVLVALGGTPSKYTAADDDRNHAAPRIGRTSPHRLVDIGDSHLPSGLRPSVHARGAACGVGGSAGRGDRGAWPPAPGLARVRRRAGRR